MSTQIETAANVSASTGFTPNSRLAISRVICQCAGYAYHNTQQCQRHSLLKYQSQDVSLLRTQGHAHTNFRSVVRNEKREHGVDTNYRQRDVKTSFAAFQNLFRAFSALTTLPPLPWAVGPSFYITRLWG